MKGLLLKYMLYNTFGRPDAWSFAALRDDKRTEAWLARLLLLLGDGGEGGEGATLLYICSNSACTA
jgi:hypothetical protein